MMYRAPAEGSNTVYSTGNGSVYFGRCAYAAAVSATNGSAERVGGAFARSGRRAGAALGRGLRPAACAAASGGVLALPTAGAEGASGTAGRSTAPGPTGGREPAASSGENTTLDKVLVPAPANPSRRLAAGSSSSEVMAGESESAAGSRPVGAVSVTDEAGGEATAGTVAGAQAGGATGCSIPADSTVCGAAAGGAALRGSPSVGLMGDGKCDTLSAALSCGAGGAG